MTANWHCVALSCHHVCNGPSPHGNHALRLHTLFAFSLDRLVEKVCLGIRCKAVTGLKAGYMQWAPDNYAYN